MSLACGLFSNQFSDNCERPPLSRRISFPLCPLNVDLKLWLIIANRSTKIPPRSIHVQHLLSAAYRIVKYTDTSSSLLLRLLNFPFYQEASWCSMSQIRGTAGYHLGNQSPFGGPSRTDSTSDPSPLDSIREQTSKIEDWLDTISDPVKPLVIHKSEQSRRFCGTFDKETLV